MFQLPPHARVDAGKLDAFLAIVPDDIPVAFEFRHASWQDEAVYTVLEQHGAAWVQADNDGAEPPEFPKTAKHAYLRLRAAEYSDAVLKSWKRRCEDFETVFVYFKHEDGDAGPAYAKRMLEL